MSAGMSSMAANNSDLRAQQLLASYVRAGYAPIDPPMLQPAEPFLDLSGEDIRRRMFLTERSARARTVPAARSHHSGLARLSAIARGRQGGGLLLSRARCFAIARARPPKFVQAGIESFGRQDKAAADAEMLSLGLEATRSLRLADAAKSASATSGCSPPSSPRSISRRRGSAAWSRISTASPRWPTISISWRSTPRAARRNTSGVLAALAGSDPKAAHHLVTDLLSIAGIAAVGGRSVGEIAERFLEQAALGAGTRLPRETRALDRALPRRARRSRRSRRRTARARRRRRICRSTPALDLFETRTGFLAARGVDVRAINFSTAFGRGFDYYTGFVFELHDARAPRARSSPGGRYDGLLTRLGAHEPIPAVGFAASIEELAAALAETARAMSAPLILAVPPRAACRKTPKRSSRAPGSNS